MDEIVNRIIKIKDFILENDPITWHPDKVYTAMNKLASLKASLGSFVASLELEASTLENSRKLAGAKGKLNRINDGGSVSKSEIEVELELESLRKEEATAHYNYTLVKNLYEDAGTMITTLQSTARYLAKEKDETNMSQYKQ